MLLNQIRYDLLLHSRINYYKSNEDDIYFQFHCLYNASTELYDRTLTNMRSPYDPTEAFIYGRYKSLSNANAKRTYDKCINGIENITHKSFEYKRWKNCVRQYFNLSAQNWIDIAEHLYESGKIQSEILKYVNPFPFIYYDTRGNK